jgi:hypothetical protein
VTFLLVVIDSGYFAFGRLFRIAAEVVAWIRLIFSPGSISS